MKTLSRGCVNWAVAIFVSLLAACQSPVTATAPPTATAIPIAPSITPTATLPRATATPQPTDTPEPTSTLRPTLTPEPTATNLAQTVVLRWHRYLYCPDGCLGLYFSFIPDWTLYANGLLVQSMIWDEQAFSYGTHSRMLSKSEMCNLIKRFSTTPINTIRQKATFSYKDVKYFYMPESIINTTNDSITKVMFDPKGYYLPSSQSVANELKPLWVSATQMLTSSFEIANDYIPDRIALFIISEEKRDWTKDMVLLSLSTSDKEIPTWKSETVQLAKLAERVKSNSYDASYILLSDNEAREVYAQMGSKSFYNRLFIENGKHYYLSTRVLLPDENFYLDPLPDYDNLTIAQMSPRHVQLGCN